MHKTLWTKTACLRMDSKKVKVVQEWSPREMVRPEFRHNLLSMPVQVKLKELLVKFILTMEPRLEFVPLHLTNNILPADLIIWKSLRKDSKSDKVVRDNKLRTGLPVT